MAPCVCPCHGPVCLPVPWPRVSARAMAPCVCPCHGPVRLPVPWPRVSARALAPCVCPCHGPVRQHVPWPRASARGPRRPAIMGPAVTGAPPSRAAQPPRAPPSREPGHRPRRHRSPSSQPRRLGSPALTGGAMPQSYDVSDMGMIGDARAGAITVGVDGGSQFCLDSSSLHLDDVPETALARHGLAASALSMPVRHCAPKGGSTAVCRWRAGPHPSVSLVTARSVHREPSERTQSEFLSMDPCDVPASPSIRMADGLRRVLREQAF